MKKMYLGISIILFAILNEVSYTGHFAYISSGIGFIGLLLVFLGYREK